MEQKTRVVPAMSREKRLLVSPDKAYRCWQLMLHTHTHNPERVRQNARERLELLLPLGFYNGRLEIMSGQAQYQ